MQQLTMVTILPEVPLTFCTVFYTYYSKSRLTIVSREAKKKQAVRNEQVSYLHVAPL